MGLVPARRRSFLFTPIPAGGLLNIYYTIYHPMVILYIQHPWVDCWMDCNMASLAVPVPRRLRHRFLFAYCPGQCIMIYDGECKKLAPPTGGKDSHSINHDITQLQQTRRQHRHNNNTANKKGTEMILIKSTIVYWKLYVYVYKKCMCVVYVWSVWCT